MERLKQNKDIMLCSIVIGVLIAIIFMMIYQYMYPSAEGFTDPNSLDPATKALLAYHLTSDPVGIVSPKLIKGKGKEGFCHHATC